MEDALVNAVDAVNVVTLTHQELTILQLLSRGYSQAQIARVLNTDAGEVEHCVAEIQTQLDAPNVYRAVALAVQRGLIV